MRFEKINLDEVSLFLRLKGTAIRRIYLSVIGYSLYVAGIAGIHFYYYRIVALNNIGGVLGVIIALLLGFRTNSAYQKYDAGRRAWSTLKITIRDMTRAIWVYAPTHTTRELIAKKTAINLLDAFCHGLKHYLRYEYSGTELDIEPFLKPIQKFELRPKSIPKTSDMTSRRDAYLAHSYLPPTNIPLEIIYQLTLYGKSAPEYSPSIDPSLWYNVAGGIGTLEMNLSLLEELHRTPIPICYAAHLSHALWVYLLVMPFLLVNNLGWWVIPNLVLTFFAFEGCMSISAEMEDPFGYDANDLPLDMFCWTIRKELAQITSELTPEFGSWASSAGNHPLYPYDSISAEEWGSKSLEEANNLLLNLRFDANPVERNREDWKKAFREDHNTHRKIDTNV